MTITFVVLQTAGMAGVMIWDWKTHGDECYAFYFCLVVALLNLGPAFFYLVSACERCGGDSDAPQTKSQALLLIEVVLEAYPQFSLQLYIAAYRNQFGILLIVSVLSSFWRVGNGMLKGACACFVKTGTIFDKLGLNNKDLANSTILLSLAVFLFDKLSSAAGLLRRDGPARTHGFRSLPSRLLAPHGLGFRSESVLQGQHRDLRSSVFGHLAARFYNRVTLHFIFLARGFVSLHRHLLRRSVN